MANVRLWMVVMKTSHLSRYGDMSSEVDAALMLRFQFSHETAGRSLRREQATSKM
ncbi:hypothetical protein CA54_43120 [Symmachiella macrocystis]|uniref:Uncharacterized protein n=1 Tax=Symmachiella macrocystis TaxID=2527985 RepID=A0A5C6BBL5_9PLAN|nr:hypothetical protein [Symmachiella macrocystis]TWU09072.1 hypothetical protein CA54_43120 [Symmachiella macrocystis]